MYRLALYVPKDWTFFKVLKFAHKYSKPSTKLILFNLNSIRTPFINIANAINQNLVIGNTVFISKSEEILH